MALAGKYLDSWNISGLMVLAEFGVRKYLAHGQLEISEKGRSLSFFLLLEIHVTIEKLDIAFGILDILHNSCILQISH